MRTAFHISLPCLLLFTLLWGGCISCEQFYMWPGAKSCCAADGHCKTKAPSQQKPDRDCKLIAFDDHKAVDLEVDLPVVAVIETELPVPFVAFSEYSRGMDPIGPSPPDLRILHSTFLL